jgi:hypothetical protein
LLADQAKAAAKLFVGDRQGHQIVLLSVDAGSQIVAIGDEALDCRHAGESDCLDRRVGGAPGTLGPGARRRDMLQGVDHCKRTPVIGARGGQSGDLTELRTSFVALSGRRWLFFASMMNREEPASRRR